MTGRIVVGIDGSNGSRCALAWALEETTLRESVLEAVIIWKSPYDFAELPLYPVDEAKLAETANQRLTEAIREAPLAKDDLEVQPLVLEGDPAESLCKRAVDADLLVVGARGHGTFASLLLGSVSSKCAHHSPVPVVIVPSHHRGAPNQSVATGHIVVGVDGSEGSRRALRWAVDEAAIRGAAVTALRVRRGIETDDDIALELATFPSRTRRDSALAETAKERLERLVSELASESAVEIEPFLLEGDPAETLCKRAAEGDLLVVGSRGHGTFTGPLGSVSTKCAHHSPGPVVIVPTDRS